MRILLLSQDFDISGGVGKYLQRLVPALAGAGHSVGVVEAARSDHPEWPEGITVRRVPHFDAWDRQLRGNATEEVLSIVANLAPDVVHVHSGSNFDLERELRRRHAVVKTLHTLEFCPTGSRYHFATRRICVHRAGWMCLPRIGYKRCTLSKRPTVWWRAVRRSLVSRALHRDYPIVTVASSFARQVAIDEGLSPARVHVVPYFTDVPVDVAPPPGQARILFAARIYPEKGLDLLVRAIARLAPRRVALDVVGDGPGVPAIKQLAERLGVGSTITFHGWQHAIDRFYRGASVLVVPSRLAEPFGIVGIEAMSHARPAVAFAVGGISDWLQDGVTGFLVRPFDVEAMADRIGQLVDSPETCRRMGLEGRRVATERFTVEAHVARLVALYAQVARV